MPPPVQQVGGNDSQTVNRILSVGRFFVGGHSKRQDALIEVFKSIVSQVSQPSELHLAGSSMPEPQHMDYLAGLFEMAEGYPVIFHVNPSMERLHQLYREATLYWHGTGIGADLAATPEKAEHFGISIVEAMSAYTIPLALASGGPREIIDHREDGFLYDSPEELARLTVSLLDPEASEWRRHVSRAAARKASEFSRDKFAERFNLMLAKLVEQVA
jgi:glycosyltransferase involved in cell wall biosynthesis